MSDIRYDRLRDTHVIIAPKRLHRPDASVVHKDELSVANCPFCEGNEELTPKEIFAMRDPQTFANSGGWQTRVVPNLYKALAIEAPHHHHSGSFEYWDGFGAHEVIIDSPVHRTSMMEWNHNEMVLWLKTLRERVEDLRCDHRIVFISLFKNEGFDAGSTMEHCHTQLIGLPLIPKAQREMNRLSREYFERHRHCLMESMIRDEEEAQIRMIESVGAFSAFCPYASEYPFEVMISSKQCIGQIDTIDDVHLDDLASLFESVLQKMREQLQDVAFNVWISTPPLAQEMGESEAHRLMIRLTPRIYRFGGFEVNTGMMINPVSPEVAAKVLRGEKHE
jgi:UDPglucose--hexose-1-phosphate uridylyltransferase